MEDHDEEIQEDIMQELFDEEAEPENDSQIEASSEGESLLGRTAPSLRSDEGTQSVDPPENYLPQVEKMVERLELEINNVFSGCNDIDRELREIEDEAQLVQKNVYTMIASESELAIINRLTILLARAISAIVTTRGYTSNIRASQNRSQESIEMFRDLVEESEE